MPQVDAKDVEIANLKDALGNAMRTNADLQAELDRANRALATLRREYEEARKK
jgi:hypothetical protein